MLYVYETTPRNRWWLCPWYGGIKQLDLQTVLRPLLLRAVYHIITSAPTGALLCCCLTFGNCLTGTNAERRRKHTHKNLNQPLGREWERGKWNYLNRFFHWEVKLTIYSVSHCCEVGMDLMWRVGLWKLKLGTEANKRWIRGEGGGGGTFFSPSCSSSSVFNNNHKTKKVYMCMLARMHSHTHTHTHTHMHTHTHTHNTHTCTHTHTYTPELQ